MLLVRGGAGSIGSHLATHLVVLDEAVRIFNNFSSGTPANLEAVRDRIMLLEATYGTKVRCAMPLEVPASSFTRRLSPPCKGRSPIPTRRRT
jgi:nucleoside-diphosphate-sugar epimerase